MKNKVCIIIGGSSDIGIELIKNMLKRGYVVYSTYNSTNPTFNSEKLIWEKVDLTKNDEVKKYINFLRQNVENINVFFYNASMQMRKRLKDTTDEYINNIFNVNVFSCFKMIRDLFDIFDNSCKIIITGSQMGINPHSVSPIYGMTKECLHSMVKNLVKEFDSTNITINAVVPGFVETRLQKDKPLEIRESIYNKTALHRFATVEEIVKGYEFCLDNDFVNGILIEINGGYNYK